jgi:hypothetical protein
MKKVEEKNNRGSKKSLHESNDNKFNLSALTERERPRSRNFGKCQMYEVLSHDSTGPAEDLN